MFIVVKFITNFVFPGFIFVAGFTRLASAFFSRVVTAMLAWIIRPAVTLLRILSDGIPKVICSR